MKENEFILEKLQITENQRAAYAKKLNLEQQTMIIL
jgi:hypothetical protein